MIVFCHVVFAIIIISFSDARPCLGPSCVDLCTGPSCDSNYLCSGSSCSSGYACRESQCRSTCGQNSCRTCTNTQECDTQCCENRNCCEQNCCQNCPCTPITPVTSTPDVTHVTPDRIRYTIITQRPYYPPVSSNNETIINTNNNSIIIPTNITIENVVRSETHITIPVNISVNNVNNVHITSELSSNATEEKRSRDWETRPNETIVKVVNVSYPVPFPVPVPVPHIIRIPYQQPAPSGCCNMVQPCVPYHYCGCQMSSVHCSDQCQQSYMYQPVDICHAGCQKRRIAVGQHCSYGGCFEGLTDCSGCQPDFFQNYDSFLRCSGCFVPTPWGQSGWY